MWSWLKGVGRRLGSRLEGAGRSRVGRRERGKRRCSPTLETLEDRVVPAVQAASLADTTMLSDTAAGNVQGPSSVSKDGRYVVYSSSAANLVSGQVMDSKSAADVFLYDRATGTTTLVSHADGSSTTTATGTSKNPVISADGKWVAYVSNSDNLLSGGTLADDTYSLVVQGYTGGDFALTYGGHTATVSYNATASAVQSALENLSGVGKNNVSVSGGSGEPFTITFVGNLAHAASSPLTADGSGLTGGGLFGGNFVFLGGHNEFLCDQYAVYLYSVQDGTTTLVSHVASDQGTGYQKTVSEGTSGILTGAQGGLTSLASQTTSVSISGDGSYVAYVSTAGHLVDGQEQGFLNVTNPPLGTRANVFVYDRSADTNYLVSGIWDSSLNGGSGGQSPTTPGDNTSYVAVINQDGNTIAFTSQDVNLVKGQHADTGSGFAGGEFEQYFVSQRKGTSWATATTALITHANGDVTQESTASTTDADYPAPAITPDGHWIAYVSVQDNLITGFNVSGVKGDNYYLYDTTNDGSTTNNNTLVSHKANDATTAGNAGPGSSLLSVTTGPAPAVSDDGRFVAFYSAATNLTSTATSSGYNVFVFDRQGTDANNNVTLITHKSIPTKSFPATTYPPLTPSISGDGRYIAYVGFATADVSGLTDVNNLPGSKGLDALLYDQNNGSYTLLSHAYSSANTTGTGEAYSPVVSEDGSTVLYLDDSTNLLPTTVNGHTGQDLNAALPTDGTDLYAYNLVKPSYKVVVGNGETGTADVGTNSTVTLRDPNLPSNTANGLSEISPVHSVSDDGNYTVFVSNAPNLVAGEVDTNLTQNVYLYNRSANTVTLISHKNGSDTTTGNGESANAVISGDGKTVVFYSFATDLTGDTITSGTVQLYLYDNDPSHTSTYGKLQLITHGPTSGTATQGTNGTLPGTPNGVLSGYSTLLYSSIGLFTGATGLALPSLSSDGKYIAYLSNATNLSETNSGASRVNVFLYDRGADTNKLVSHANGVSTSGNGNSSTVAISADGSTIAFTSKATNLLSSSITTSGDQLYVWSRIDNTTGATGLSEGQIVLASHASSGTGTAASFATGTASSLWGPLPASLSSDGAFVAYYFGGKDLVSGQDGTASPLNVFRYDVKNNTNALVSHANSSATTAGDNPSNDNLYEASGPAISSDGRYIAYANNSTNLIVPPTGFNWTNSQNGRDNVYLYDANQTDVTKQNTLVSHKADDPTTTANEALTPDDNGGTSPSISADGTFVSFIDFALPDTNTVPQDELNCTYSGTAAVRLYDSQASATAQPTVVGNAFNPTSLLLVGATLAPTVLSGDGTTVAWDGLASDVVNGDLNGNLDVFVTAPPTTTADPASISTTSGNQQTVTVNQSFSTSLTVTVKDVNNQPIEGVTVTFKAPTTGPSGTFTGNVTTIQVHTDKNGEAKVPFTANTISGSYTVTATVTNSTGTTFSTKFDLTNDPDAPAKITATQLATPSTVVNTSYTGTLQITLTDKYDNPEKDPFTITFTAPPSGPSGTFKDPTTGTQVTSVNITTDSTGVAKAPIFTANTIAGSFQVTATYQVDSTTTLTATFDLTNKPGDPDHLVATPLTDPTAVVAKDYQPLQVTLEDQYNNPVGKDFTVTFSAPGSGPSATFSGGGTATTNDSGVASITPTANTHAGSFQVTATYTPTTGTAKTATFDLTNKPDVPATITATAGTSQSAVANKDFAQTLQVQLKDQYGNPVDSGITVTFTAPSSGPSATLSNGGTATTDANGVAFVTATANTKAGGPYTISVATTGVSATSPFSLTNTPDVPASVTVVSGSSQTATVAAAYSSKLKVVVTDQYGNPVPNKTVTFAAPGSGPSVTFEGGVTTATTGSDGVALSPALTANTAAGTFTVNATVQGVSTPASFSLTNAPGTPTSLTLFAGNSQSTTILQAFPTALQIKATDTYGNPVPGVTGITFSAPAGGPSGTFNGSLTASATTDANGVATAPTLTANGTPGTFAVTATLSGAGSSVFQLTNKPVPTDVVYVDASWAGLAAGVDPDGAGPALLFGPGGNAFATLQDAESAVTVGGKIIVAGGTYSGAVNIVNAGTVQYNGPITLNTGGGSVNFGPATAVVGPGGQSLTVNAAGGDVTFGNPNAALTLGSLSLDSAHNVTLAGPLNLSGNLVETNGTGTTSLSAGTVGGSLTVLTTNVNFGPGQLAAAAANVQATGGLTLPAGTTLQSPGMVILGGGSNNPAGGFVTLTGAVSGANVVVTGGPGPDAFFLGALSGGFTLDAGGGANKLTLDLSGVAANQTLVLGSTTISSSVLPGPIVYGASGGNYGSLLTILTGPGADTVAVQSLPAGAPTLISTGDGNDAVTVGSAGLPDSVLDGLLSALTVDAGPGSNALTVSEAGRTTADTVFLTGGSITSQADPSGIWYRASGGTFGQGVTYIGGTSADTFVVLGTSPGSPTTVYGHGGTDTFNVGVTTLSGYQAVTLDGGGTGTLGVYDMSGAAAVQTFPTGPGIGVVAASYTGGAQSVVNYQNMAGTTSNVSADQTFLELVYRQEVGRAAGPDDLAAWLPILQGPGGRAAVVDGINHSAAATERRVVGWFQRYLGHTPVGGQELGFVNRLLQGQSEETVLADLLASDENFKLAGGTDAGFVQRLFTQLLNRPARPDEVSLYTGTLLPQVGRAGAAWLALTSLDHRRLAVAEEYQTLLHRTGLGLADLDYWAAGGLDLLTIHERLELTPDFVAANV
jgi:hypothetical protein